MKALFSAATGMAAQQIQIDTIANNLANVSTNGFKKTRVAFEDLVYENVRTGEASADSKRPGQLEIGSGARVVATQRDFTPGSISQTNAPLDVAIQGRGFFVVETPDGSERYTRVGSFNVNQDSELVTQQGYPISPGIQIPMDAEEVIVAEDGTISVRYGDSTDTVTVGALDVMDFTNPNGLKALGGNLYSATAESGDPIALDASDGLILKQGFIEGSNVDIAEELVNMIMAQRSFEVTSKAVESADETMQIVNQMKR
jgi:flagellar basal-body rod protein FlgG